MPDQSDISAVIVLLFKANETKNLSRLAERNWANVESTLR